MARVTELPGALGIVWMWDVTDPVGWRLHNRRSDVQLVQAAINKLITPLGLVDGRTSTPGPTGPQYAALKPLNPDGYWGNETANAVQSYQDSASRRFACARDGFVDPAYVLLQRLGGDPISPGVLTAWGLLQRRTIFALNRDHLAAYGRMLDLGDSPPVLRAEVGRL